MIIALLVAVIAFAASLIVIIVYSIKTDKAWRAVMENIAAMYANLLEIERIQRETREMRRGR